MDPNNPNPPTMAQYFPPPAHAPKAHEYSLGYAPGETAVGYDPTTDAAIVRKAIGPSTTSPPFLLPAL